MKLMSHSYAMHCLLLLSPFAYALELKRKETTSTSPNGAVFKEMSGLDLGRTSAN